MKKNKETGSHPLVTWLRPQLQAWLTKLAFRLQERADRHTIKTQKGALVLFCLFSAAASVWIAAQSLEKRTSFPITVAPIQALPLRQGATLKPSLSATERARIYHFKQRLDSLKKTAGGRDVANDYLKQRPLLVDTIRYLEKFYGKQQINSNEK